MGRLALVFSLASALGSPAAGAVVGERCRWTGSSARPAFHDVIASPLVMDFDSDGRPEIAFLAEDPVHGTAILVVVDGRDCSTIVEIGDPGCVPCVGDAGCRDLDLTGNGGILLPYGIAAGDLDHDGRAEIIGTLKGAPGEGPRRIAAFDSSGTFLWCSEPAPPGVLGLSSLGPGIPSIADLDGDGSPEIVVGTGVFSSEGRFLNSSGAIDFSLWDTPSVPADVDGDGTLELVVGATVLTAGSTPVWTRSGPGSGFSKVPSAPVDLDADGLPEVVVFRAEPNQLVVLDGRTGELRAAEALPPDDPSCRSIMGSPAVGDIDADGTAEVLALTGTRACLLDHSPGPPEALELRWCEPVRDCTGGGLTGILADVDGDGLSEVLVHDELAVSVFTAEGRLLQRIENSSSTHWESLVAADVDGDCGGELLVVADGQGGGGDRGLRIFEGEDDRLPGYRPLWNQNAYHSNNVREGGQIPSPWEVPTSFKQQVVVPPPAVSLVAEIETLWPPNHRMVSLALSDPGGAPVRVTSIFQDEPVDERGDGAFVPDAAWDGSAVLLRAERSGGGDGRVYHVTADVGAPGCEQSRTLTVCVPHDQRDHATGASCVDQGALFDSTRP